MSRLSLLLLGLVACETAGDVPQDVRDWAVATTARWDRMPETSLGQMGNTRPKAGLQIKVCLGGGEQISDGSDVALWHNETVAPGWCVMLVGDGSRWLELARWPP